MSSIPVLNDEQWLKLLEQVASTFNEVTLSRGFTYFKQQRVATLIISEDRLVQARVTGSEEYRVTLNLDKLRSSSCTCPVQTSCKHLAAVMMELANRFGYTATQIVNAKHHLKRTDSVSASESLLNSLPNMDVFGWHEFLNQYTSHVKPGYDQGMFTDLLRYQLQNIRKGAIPFLATDWIYFELHQELFILRKIKEQNAQGSVNYYTSFALYRMYDEIHALLKQKSAQFNFTHSGERLKQTLSYIRQQLAEETGHKYLDYGLYTALWKYWIAPHPKADDWVSQEINEIEKQPTDSPSDSLSTVRAFLYLHQSRSNEAWAALEASGSLKKAPASLFLPFLNHISDTRDWANLVDWLKRTASYFYGQKTKELDAYISYWKEAIAHDPEAEKHLWNVLEGMLPHSTPIIEDVLYEQRKWKPWVEMQILQGHDPLYHRVSVLQPIEKEAPGLLLPYYHQAIDHYVTLKNRHNYKLAVRLLKRLEKVYKKMKQIERWDRFLTGFMERHSRLRALQEEMKKGKLLE
ncbi:MULTISPECIES: SWIM zinc finger family protein [unclassified Paenibacillus]|uniref:SWIM zinc finger family protein n=1 Tax=unclassified Paenibacillus TaxID=185978 RepID=UPI001AEB149A|nr:MULTISPECIES: SWIM zinc finger family protein [unclassified Paenibacillus]MBP1153993.1 hypothetical protein [Paenibacillus sp. PvP091]MBP1170622.1 hypothetical protein [Paenibacillus sp. PvR098]MBP2441650.1 hypothetical protein [Paenibacillus sp. PvP052]